MGLGVMQVYVQCKMLWNTHGAAVQDSMGSSPDGPTVSDYATTPSVR